MSRCLLQSESSEFEARVIHNIVSVLQDNMLQNSSSVVLEGLFIQEYNPKSDGMHVPEYCSELSNHLH